MGKILIRPELQGGCTVGGTEVISSTGAYKGVISTTNITATGNTVIGDSASDTMAINALTTVTTNQKIQYRDTGIYTYSSANGVFDVVSDTTLNLTGGAVTFAVTASGLSGTTLISNTVTSTSATPSNVRSIIGAVVDATTITSGLLTGVRGLATIASASGGFVYGTQGKLAVTGTLSGSVWAAGLFGQLDMSAATVNAGQVAAIWGDWGATSGTETDMTGARGIVMTNTTDATLNAQIYLYGKATYFAELAGPGSVETYVAAAGTSAGSAGDTSKCNATKVLAISIDGVAHYIPVFAQNT